MVANRASPADLSLACVRCGSRLVPIVAPWGRGRDSGTRPFRCPRLSACGYGGLTEDAAVARRFRAGEAVEPADALTP